MKYIRLSLVLFAVLLLTACGAESKKTESEIIDDVIANNSIYSDCGLEITSYEITSRLTSTERMTDDVEVTVKSECDEFAYSEDYTLHYLLYDDGWILNDFDRSEANWTAKTIISQEEADAIVAASYENAAFLSEESHDNYYLFQYSVDVPGDGNYKYLMYEKIISLEYIFYPNVWSPSITDKDVGKYWNIVGEWAYNDSENSLWLNVISVNETEIAVEYTLSGKDVGYFSSNGVEHLNYEIERDDVMPSYTSELYTENGNRIWIRSSEGIHFGGHKNGQWLTYNP